MALRQDVAFLACLRLRLAGSHLGLSSRRSRRVFPPLSSFNASYFVGHHPMLPFDREIQSKGNIECFYLTFSRKRRFKRSNRCSLYALWVQIPTQKGI